MDITTPYPSVCKRRGPRHFALRLVPCIDCGERVEESLPSFTSHYQSSHSDMLVIFNTDASRTTYISEKLSLSQTQQAEIRHSRRSPSTTSVKRAKTSEKSPTRRNRLKTSDKSSAYHVPVPPLPSTSSTQTAVHNQSRSATPSSSTLLRQHAHQPPTENTLLAFPHQRETPLSVISPAPSVSPVRKSAPLLYIPQQHHHQNSPSPPSPEAPMPLNDNTSSALNVPSSRPSKLNADNASTNTRSMPPNSVPSQPSVVSMPPGNVSPRSSHLSMPPENVPAQAEQSVSSKNDSIAIDGMDMPPTDVVETTTSRTPPRDVSPEDGDKHAQQQELTEWEKLPEVQQVKARKRTGSEIVQDAADGEISTGPRSGSPNPTDHVAISYKEPPSQPLKLENLIAEVKKIYSKLVNMENICLRTDSEGIPTFEKTMSAPISNTQWQQIIASHRQLLAHHHDFLMVSQHPLATPQLRALPTEYSTPARLCRHGVHSLLEVFRQRLPATAEYMISFIYHAHGTISMFYELFPTFNETWVECLGDLSHYRMLLVEDNDIEARDAWIDSSRYWYYKAIDLAPANGGLYHQLGTLASHKPLEQLFYYCKSLSVRRSYQMTFRSIQNLFEPSLALDLNQPREHIRQIQLDVSFVRVHSVFFTGQNEERLASFTVDFLTALKKLLSKPSTRGANSGYFAALSNCCAIYEYGVEFGVLRLAASQSFRGRVSSSAHSSSLLGFPKNLSPSVTSGSTPSSTPTTTSSLSSSSSQSSSTSSFVSTTSPSSASVNSPVPAPTSAFGTVNGNSQSWKPSNVFNPPTMPMVHPSAPFPPTSSIFASRVPTVPSCTNDSGRRNSNSMMFIREESTLPMPAQPFHLGCGSPTFQRALHFSEETHRMVLSHPRNAFSYAYIHILLMFLWHVVRIPGVVELINDSIPWTLLAQALNIIQSLVPDPNLASSILDINKYHPPLPEDHALRGLPWAEHFYPQAWFSRPGEDSERTMESAQVMEKRMLRCIFLGRKIAAFAVGKPELVHLWFDVQAKNFIPSPKYREDSILPCSNVSPMGTASPTGSTMPNLPQLTDSNKPPSLSFTSDGHPIGGKASSLSTPSIAVPTRPQSAPPVKFLQGFAAACRPSLSSRETNAVSSQPIHNPATHDNNISPLPSSTKSTTTAVTGTTTTTTMTAPSDINHRTPQASGIQPSVSVSEIAPQRAVNATTSEIPSVATSNPTPLPSSLVSPDS